MLLPLFAFEMNADEKEVKKIPLQLQTSGRLCRSLTEAPIEANYYAISSTLQTVALSDVGQIVLTVTNYSTGEFCSYSFDSTVETICLLELFGTSGCYEVSYFTETGDIYSGIFNIE